MCDFYVACLCECTFFCRPTVKYVALEGDDPDYNVALAVVFKLDPSALARYDAVRLRCDKYQICRASVRVRKLNVLVARPRRKAVGLCLRAALNSVL